MDFISFVAPLELLYHSDIGIKKSANEIDGSVCSFFLVYFTNLYPKIGSWPVK